MIYDVFAYISFLMYCIAAALIHLVLLFLRLLVLGTVILCFGSGPVLSNGCVLLCLCMSVYNYTDVMIMVIHDQLKNTNDPQTTTVFIVNRSKVLP
jgi:hypothetical protein